MIYIVLFFTTVSIWSAAYAITLPERIQYLLNIGEQDNVERLIEELAGGERFYLLASAAPFFLIPALFFTGDLPRSSLYGFVMILLIIIGMTKKDSFIKNSNLIRVESTIELVMFSDIVRNCIVTLWG